MDFELTRENIMIRTEIRKWVNRECTREIVRELDEADAFPEALFSKLAALGFCGLIVPEALQGEGQKILGACLVTEEIAVRYPVLAACYTAPTFWGGYLIGRLGSEDQKNRYLPLCAEGQFVPVPLLSGIEEHSENTAHRVQAVADGDDQVISGEAPFVLLADQADLLIVPAWSDSGLSLLLVENTADGLTVTPIEKVGYKGLGLCRVSFDRVRVRRTDILGGADAEGKGQAALKTIQDTTLLAAGAAAVGMAQGAFDYALQHARQRVQFGQAIGRFTAISHQFADSAARIEAARFAVYRAAWSAEQNKPFSREAAMAKLLAEQIAVSAAMEGLQVYGGYGYTMEYDMQRYVRDAAAMPFFGLQTASVKDRIASTIGL
jgi:alkylation response protein AidB-like acyl-CoA dehydrogenase